jgi:cytoskeletal protein CcmA (bactofilin family)
MAFKDLMNRGERPEPTGVASAATPQASPQFSPQPPPAAPVVPRSAGVATFMDVSTEFTGQVHAKDSLRIDGRMSGEIRCDHTLVVGETAVVQATIDADSVVIAGEVRGDIRARRKITLEKTARVVGDLCTPGIVIQEGAKLEGRIMIGPEAPNTAERPAARQAEKAAGAAEAKPRDGAAARPAAAAGAAAPPAS